MQRRLLCQLLNVIFQYIKNFCNILNQTLQYLYNNYEKKLFLFLNNLSIFISSINMEFL